jgi:hypothetical protein
MFKKRINTEANPEAIYFSRSGLYMAAVRMAAFMVMACALAGAIAPTLGHIFFSSRLINGFILLVFAFGVAINVRNVAVLFGDMEWLNRFFAGRDAGRVPSLISPVAFLLREHRKNHKPYMEAATMRALLDIVDSRISDLKSSANYFSGVLVFLGLLGTFWGLLMTIGSVGDVVRNLEVNGGDVGAMFEALKAGISRPLSGMGTAFSTSLFGLGASLVLGFLQLQGNLASHFFYNELEENITRYTRIVSAGAAGDGSIVTYLQAMLEQTADSLGTLQKTVARSVESNAEAAKRMATMSAEVAKLATQMQEKLKAMEKISASPDKLYPVLADLVKISKSGFGMDDRTREHIRNMDAGLADMADRISSDIRLLAKTVAMRGEPKDARK